MISGGDVVQRKSEAFSAVAAIVCLILYVMLFPTIGTLMMLFAIAVHELGHIVAIVLSGERVDSIGISPFGLSIRRSGRLCSYKTELLVYLFGPFANVLAFLLFHGANNPFLSSFAEQSLAFGILNLLPVRSLDGGRALETAFLMFGNEKTAETVVCILSAAVFLLMWLISVWSLLMYGEGLSLFAFSCWLFFSLFLKKRSS